MIRSFLALGLLLSTSSAFALTDADYVFDPATLRQISMSVVAKRLPPEIMIPTLRAELVKRYPGHIVPEVTWDFNLAGGALFQVSIMMCTPREYLIFFGSPLPVSSSFTGRYPDLDLMDFYLDGDLETYSEGDFNATKYGPGSVSVHERGMGKAFTVKDHVWVMEYARGSTLSAIDYAVLAAAESKALPWFYAWKQIGHCAKSATHELLSNHHPSGHADPGIFDESPPTEF
ncbi:MAG: hypothetical protein ACXVBW_04795 [Bdellovibrionota bacterium]